MRPESLMMSHGHSAKLAQGSVKTPIHQTSTFAFETAEEGKAYFELAYGLRKPDVDETMGFIYSRISNPTLEVLEQRLCLWDQAADCAAFSSGMAAISNVLLTFLKPGDLLVFSNPVYGGTDHFIRQYLPGIGVNVLDIHPQESIEQIKTRINESGHADRLAMIFLETPANPTNDLYDIDALHQLAQRYSNADKKVLLAVDNTYMGPLWQHPLQHGADLVIYSATKYIGGHSDVIAGAVLGSTAHIQEVKGLRAFLGNMASPHTCWLLLRSLETLKVRMEQQARTAAQLALYLGNHPLVDKTYYLGDLEPCDDGYEVFKKQLLSPGAMISFDILGGEKPPPGEIGSEPW
jgi:methionine-gamma-lyase